MKESGGSESPIIVIAGPTASGKSRLAVAVAREFGGAIINADSMQVYRDLRVVTARPGDAEMKAVPHFLYGDIDAGESCSAGRWRGLALAAIARTRAAELLPVIAGGTGLYISALLDGLADVPPVSEDIVAETRELHARMGGEKFRAALAELDPEAAKRLHAGDTQRLIRAYAVARATGVALSEWQRRQKAGAMPDAAAIVLLPPREELYAAIDARLRSMFEAGAIEEVRDLLARKLAPELPAMKAVGVREISGFIAGDLTREKALAAAQQATRRYAKRQYTWLRHRLKSSKKLQKLAMEAQYSERILPEIFSFIRQFLLTTRK
jgi:tRNA dimethylallyltransferase